MHFGKVFTKAATHSTDINGFKLAGLYPVNPCILTEQISSDNLNIAPHIASNGVSKRYMSSVELPIATRFRTDGELHVRCL